jgi:hypothetical protein
MNNERDYKKRDAMEGRTVKLEKSYGQPPHHYWYTAM